MESLACDTGGAGDPDREWSDHDDIYSVLRLVSEKGKLSASEDQIDGQQKLEPAEHDFMASTPDKSVKSETQATPGIPTTTLQSQAPKNKSAPARKRPYRPRGPRTPSAQMTFNYFPQKLYRIVSNPAYESIQWHDDGNSFYIRHDFETKFLQDTTITTQERFATDKYASFIRQLNLYGFKKINVAQQTVLGKNGSSSDQPASDLPTLETESPSILQSYYHEFFVRGKDELVSKVVRKPSFRRLKKDAALATLSEVDSCPSKRSKLDDSAPSSSTSDVLKSTSYTSDQTNVLLEELTKLISQKNKRTACTKSPIATTLIKRETGSDLADFDAFDEGSGGTASTSSGQDLAKNMRLFAASMDLFKKLPPSTDRVQQTHLLSARLQHEEEAQEIANRLFNNERLYASVMDKLRNMEQAYRSKPFSADSVSAKHSSDESLWQNCAASTSMDLTWKKLVQDIVTGHTTPGQQYSSPTKQEPPLQPAALQPILQMISQQTQQKRPGKLDNCNPPPDRILQYLRSLNTLSKMAALSKNRTSPSK